ncbi:MAG: MFS transporter [Roseiflexaceae bacterium]
MLSIRLRMQQATAQLTPPIRRILLHSLLLGLAMSVADLLFNFYLVSLGYASDTAGYLSTVYRFAGVIAGVPIGMLIDRTGAQRALIAGALLFALGWIIQLTQTALWALVLTQALIGAAGLLALTSVVPLLTGVTSPEQRAAIFGMNAAAALLIGLIGGTVGGLLPGIAAGFLSTGPQTTLAYQVALGIVVVLALIAIIPVIRPVELLANERERPSTTNNKSERIPFRMLVRLSMPALLLGIGAGAFLPFQNLFFRQQFQLSDEFVGTIVACGALSMGLGAMFGSPIAKRIGLKRSSALLRALSAPAMLLMMVPFLPVAVIGYFIRGWGIGASYPLSDAFLMQIVSPRQRGTVVSALSICWSLGWAATSSIAGWSQSQHGFGPSMVVAAVAYVLSAASIMYLPDEV